MPMPAIVQTSLFFRSASLNLSQYSANHIRPPYLFSFKDVALMTRGRLHLLLLRIAVLGKWEKVVRNVFDSPLTALSFSSQAFNVSRIRDTIWTAGEDFQRLIRQTLGRDVASTYLLTITFLSCFERRYDMSREPFSLLYCL